MTLFMKIWANARPYIPDHEKVKFCKDIIEAFEAHDVEISYESAQQGWWEVAIALEELDNA